MTGAGEWKSSEGEESQVPHDPSAEGEASRRGDTEHRPADAARRALRAARERADGVVSDRLVPDHRAVGQGRSRGTRDADAASLARVATRTVASRLMS